MTMNSLTLKYKQEQTCPKQDMHWKEAPVECPRVGLQEVAGEALGGPSVQGHLRDTDISTHWSPSHHHLGWLDP